MNVEEFVLIPKSMYMRNLSANQQVTVGSQPNAISVGVGGDLASKAQQLSYLSRMQPSKSDLTRNPSAATSDNSGAEQQSFERLKEQNKQQILKELTSMSPSLRARSDVIYDKLIGIPGFSADHSGHLLYRSEPTGIDIGSFLHFLQIPRKKLSIDEKRLVRELKLGEHLVANLDAKAISHERKAPQEGYQRPSQLTTAFTRKRARVGSSKVKSKQGRQVVIDSGSDRQEDATQEDADEYFEAEKAWESFK
jgi:hypothetical protein